MGDDLVQQSLALMLGADGKAPQGRAEAASRGDCFPVFVLHGANVVQIPVPGDPFLLKQLIDLGQSALV